MFKSLSLVLYHGLLIHKLSWEEGYIPSKEFCLLLIDNCCAFGETPLLVVRRCVCVCLKNMFLFIRFRFICYKCERALDHTKQVIFNRFVEKHSLQIFLIFHMYGLPVVNYHKNQQEELLMYFLIWVMLAVKGGWLFFHSMFASFPMLVLISQWHISLNTRIKRIHFGGSCFCGNNKMARKVTG